MKKTPLHCQKCGSLLDSDEEKRRALCSRCRRCLARGVRFRPKEKERENIALGMGLENLGE